MPLIETQALSKRYGVVTALDNFTLAVEPGVIGLVGPNGAGKSTFIKILLGLIDATSGSATVMGRDVITQGPEVRELVGYMPEHDCLPPDMVATEFVSHMGQMSGLPKAAARERTADTLRHVGLYEERYRQIKGYSTGMKQRVKLAQALVHDPRVLFLDEPTNGLDPAGREDMLDLVRRTGRDFGISIMMSSHLLGEIERVCDHLIVIDDGALVQSAPVADFTAQTQILAVEVESGAGALEQALRRHGIEVSVDGRELLVPLDGRAPYDIVRDAVVDLDLSLVRMERRRRSLEDLFRPDAAEEEGERVAVG
jgi:ABC-2 type transport system ATP-binding protein